MSSSLSLSQNNDSVMLVGCFGKITIKKKTLTFITYLQHVRQNTKRFINLTHSINSQGKKSLFDADTLILYSYFANKDRRHKEVNNLLKSIGLEGRDFGLSFQPSNLLIMKTWISP